MVPSGTPPLWLDWKQVVTKILSFREIGTYRGGNRGCFKTWHSPKSAACLGALAGALTLGAGAFHATLIAYEFFLLK